MRMLTRVVVLAVLVFALQGPPPSFADKPITVGHGTPSSCTHADLQSALATAASNGGGTVRFNCGKAPVAIVLVHTLEVPNNTLIDGGGLVTLSGPVLGSLLTVESEAAAALQHLAITNTAGTSFLPEGIGVFNAGLLTLL